MSFRKTTAMVLAVGAALMLLLVPAAGAQSAPTQSGSSPLVNIPITGTSHHKAFSGHFTVDRFVARGGMLYAVGTLRGVVGHRSIRATNVAIPVAVSKSGPASAAATCPVLHLVLGPLNLNLLGLHVHLNKVVLDITAVSGPGNLLGNLLCSVSSLLNGGGLPLSQVAGLLNIAQQLVNIPTLLGL